MDTVVAMLENNARRVPGYWIQLFLSMGIATLGLVLDSTAVVIGAMLVSPLMGPILELGMGFAVGSSLLTLRAALRVGLSVAVVIGSAALLVLALPFHEVTREIATRTAPTALDLLVAVFCALTAAYTTVRPGSDTAAAAAGTAIGIALVPPLCTVGFGVGTASITVARGAMLLFTANLSAILVLAVLSFFLLGFNQVDAANVEKGFLFFRDTRTDNWASVAHRQLSQLFGSRYGVAMRLLIPGVFLAMVFVPLTHALDEVTWEVRSRDAVRRIVREESPDAMQTSLVVERNALRLRLLVVDSLGTSADLARRITSRVTTATGVKPVVSIVAVPDAGALLAAAAAKQRQIDEEDLRAANQPDIRVRAGTVIRAEWPPAAGRLLSWEMTTASSDSGTLTLHHLGTPLLAIGTSLLARAISAGLQTPVRVVDVAIPATVLSARGMPAARWLDSAKMLLHVVARADSVVACVRGPGFVNPKASQRDRATAKTLTQTDAGQLNRIASARADVWDIRIAAADCSQNVTPSAK